MEISIIEEKKNRLVFDLAGESHTIAGALKKELWQDDHVKAAGYAVEHPLVATPRFVVETDGAEPRKVISAAIKRLQRTITKLRDDAKKI